MMYGHWVQNKNSKTVYKENISSIRAWKVNAQVEPLHRSSLICACICNTLHHPDFIYIYDHDLDS